MSSVINFDRRRPLPSNHVFEAHDQHDETRAYHFEAWRDEEDTGVYLNFVEPDDRNGNALIRDMMWIDAEQCEEFGKALLSAAQTIREADFRDKAENGI